MLVKALALLHLSRPFKLAAPSFLSRSCVCALLHTREPLASLAVEPGRFAPVPPEPPPEGQQ